MDPTKQGKDLINQFAAIIRSSQIHDPTNVAVVSNIEKFVKYANDFIAEEGGLQIELVGEFFFINSSRVKYSMEYLLNFDYLIRELKKHGLGNVSISGNVTVEDMQQFLKVFLSSSYSPEPFEAMSEGLASAGLPHITIDVLKKVQDEGEVDIRKTVKKSYFNAVSFTKGVMKKIQAGEKISMKKAKRVVETMVDHVLDHEDFLLGMTAVKDYDEYTYHHSVNVSIVSVALAQRIGLPKKALMELGLVALLHDMGKTEIPIEVLNKPTKFTPDEWETMKRHPVLGAKAVLKMKGIDETSIRAAIVAYEHHIHNDATGYPQSRKLTELDLYSRIVSIADQYDGMTSSRVYSRIPMSPDKALSLMMKRTGPQLDPLLMKFFINMVGVYPAGTLVLLNTREMGLVSAANNMFPNRPKVLIIMDSTGKKVEEGYVVDLSEKNQQGKFTRSIIKTLDPNKYRINLADYML